MTQNITKLKDRIFVNLIVRMKTSNRQIILVIVFLTFCSTEIFICGNSVNIDCPIVGIDIGSTFSSVSVTEHGQIYVLKNELGIKQIPSTIRKDEIITGFRNQSSVQIYKVKELIQNGPSDKQIKRFNFQAIFSKKQYFFFDLLLSSKNSFSHEQIVSEFIQSLKTLAETFLGRKVENSIFTVPAHLNDKERQSMRQAGKLAGFKEIRIWNQPTLAAVAYEMDKMPDFTNILVLHLGGETLDISILTTEYGLFEIISISGESELGGTDFDQRLLDYFIYQVRNSGNIDILGDSQIIEELKQQVINAKHKLSEENSSEIVIKDVRNGIKFQSVISRTLFEGLNLDLLQRLVKQIDFALEKVKLNRSQIDKIILVGGSTNIPMVKKTVFDYFGKDLLTHIDPMEAVLIGSAMYAQMLCEQ